MKINETLAKEIAKKVMNVIPYNVNIMNDIGVIIASGDQNRINTSHQGAKVAIKEAKMISIYKSNDFEKPGVNIPINFRDRIIGVIGISGNPEVVSPLGAIVKVTAELLINQEYLFKERRFKEQMVEEFLYQWAFRLNKYDTSFINSGDSLGIDVNIPRKAIIIKGKMTKEFNYLLENEFKIRFNSENILYLVVNEKSFLNRIKQSIDSADLKVGIGNPSNIIAESVKEAQKAIEICEKLQVKEKYCIYNDLKYIDIVTNAYSDHEDIADNFISLDKTIKGNELIETLRSYIENDGDINAITKELHIHRNSLTYRLQKIETATSKNPKNLKDLFQLYIGYMVYKMKTQ